MWIILSFTASLLWGITYAIDEYIFNKISVISSLSFGCLCTFIVTLFIAYSSGVLEKDLKTVSSSKDLLFFIILGTITFILAEIVIGLSISTKNATLAGLIEVSYPLFIVLFTYLIFKKDHVNLSTIVGGLFIFVGIFTIYYFNK